MNISPTATAFEVRYDEAFEKNWMACSDYIVDRMSKAFEFLNLLTDNNYEYIGLVSQVIYDEVEQGGARKISEVLLHSEKIKGIHDINDRYGFNTDCNYRSDSSKLEELMDCMTNILENKLAALIEEGMY